jgi:hypothetical protein
MDFADIAKSIVINSSSQNCLDRSTDRGGFAIAEKKSVI